MLSGISQEPPRKLTSDLSILRAMTRRMDRRQALGAFGTVSLGAVLAGCGDDRATSPDTASRFGDASNCTLTPEMTEGPYYFDADKIRSDIRDGHDGARLDLALRVRDASCAPLANAVVDLSQCDAEGAYSESGEALVLDLSREGDAYMGTISFDVAAS
jgi:hypothetical protein